MPSSLGPMEILAILVVALIVLGPKRLPEAGRQAGKFLAEVRRWSHDMQNEIRDVIDSDPTPAATTTSATASSVTTTAPATSTPGTASTNGSSEPVAGRPLTD
ncbi:MAG TPA: twin-arginine translocase TatA/TatE family subunit [Acidimicrobiales bacterium]|nr:twin-arginine translocase TatA/TatE family subunit [Acidimicrobiales bacterium]